jgi:hypothetical protein
LEQAETISTALFKGRLHEWKEENLKTIISSLAIYKLTANDTIIIDVITAADVVSSRREVKL